MHTQSNDELWWNGAKMTATSHQMSAIVESAFFDSIAKKSYKTISTQHISKFVQSHGIILSRTTAVHVCSISSCNDDAFYTHITFYDMHFYNVMTFSCVLQQHFEAFEFIFDIMYRQCNRQPTHWTVKISISAKEDARKMANQTRTKRYNENSEECQRRILMHTYDCRYLALFFNFIYFICFQLWLLTLFVSLYPKIS